LKVLFEATAGGGGKGTDLKIYIVKFNVLFVNTVIFIKATIALDDVKLIDGPCQKTICDFDDDKICGFQVEGQSALKWVRSTETLMPQLIGYII
jgi:hypothetical protein